MRPTLYAVAWIPFAAAATLLLRDAGPGRWTQAALTAACLTIFYALVCLSPWYSGRYLPLQASAIGKLVINQGAAALAAAALLVGLAKLLGAPGSRLPILFAAGVLLYLLAAAMHYVSFSFENSRTAEARMQEARVMARDAELKALKAQINPHFLFNSLNSISALAPLDGARAREMCIRLAEFLRLTLRLGGEELIPLEQELALAQTYLEVERARFGERMRVEQAFGPECGKCLVPSLILQPLVENAVKHGVAGLVEGGWIRLDSQCRDGLLRITVENQVDCDAEPATGNGLGLANVRDRLINFYGKAARVAAEEHDHRFAVCLEIPCQT
jgi:hypothetical protein